MLQDKKPSRYQFEDVMPDGAQDDIEFQKALERLQEQQQVRGAGWLAAKGAFDRGDYQYIREQEDRKRHFEEHLQERERNEFVAARIRAEEEERKKVEMKFTAAAKRAQQESEDPSADAHKGKKSKKIGGISMPVPAPVKSIAKSKKESHIDEKKKKVSDVEKDDVKEGKDAGLAGLLQDYGSDEDEKETHINNDIIAKKKPVLPSAAALFDS